MIWEGQKKIIINKLFTGLGSVRIVKNCDLGLENAALGLRPRAAFSRPRSQFFTIRTSQPANNIYVFLRVVLYFDEPAGRVKIQTTSKNTQRYYTSKRLMSDLLSNCFHLLAFLIVSVVKTLKILKNLSSARAHTSEHSLFKTFSVRCEKFARRRKLLTKKGRNLTRSSAYNWFAEILRNDENNTIKPTTT